jgi:hypothetical protein
VESAKGPFVRFNAAQDTLIAHLPHYVDEVGKRIDEDRSALPQGPLWDEIIAFALGRLSPSPSPGPQIPGALESLAKWKNPEDRDHTLAEMGGLWYIYRLSSGSQGDNPELTVSLLNIRPHNFYRKKPSEWTEFALYLHPSRPGDPVMRVEGICYQYAAQLHFVGLLDSSGSALPTAMVLHYTKGGRYPERRYQTDGLLFVTNSHNQQISAPIEAVWIPGSHAWTDEEYEAGKQEARQKLGPFSHDEVRDLLPEAKYRSLITRSRDAMVFEAT